MSDSASLPWFLQRLALDGTADQRAIRRAYAREVKRIDQGADAEGFQRLREAYETALRWEEYQRYYAQQDAGDGVGDEAPLAATETAALAGAADVAADQPASPAAPPAPVHPDASARIAQGVPRPDPAAVADTAQAAAAAAPVPPSSSANTEAAAADLACEIDPQQLSADVFEAFIAGCSGLAQGRTLHDAAAWEQHLRTCLHDDRLMNLAARSIFEARIVHLLAAGWRTGHETLLEAAADVFQWRSDRHRLRQFGRAGAIIDRGIDERSMFDNQDREQQAAQRRVIASLREMEAPDASQLRADMPHVEQLVTRFPTWLELVANTDNIEQWRLAHAGLPPDTAPNAPPLPEERETPAAAPKRRGWGAGGRALFWLLMVTAALRFVSHEAGKPQTSVPAANPAAGQQPGATGAPKKVSSPIYNSTTQKPHFTAPPDARISEIGDRIRYRVTQMEKPGKYRVEYKVELDDQGRVASVHLEKASGLPLYDATVARAIRESAAFPPDTSRRFILSYGMQIISKPARPVQEPAPPADTTAPDTPPQ